MIEVAEIFVWSGKAYLPVLGKTEVSFFWQAGPLLTTELAVDALTVALQEIVRTGNPPIPHPTQAEFNRSTPVQKAIGMRSWRKMAEVGVLRCGIWWLEDKILVAFTPRLAKDVNEIDIENQRYFPLDTPMRTIAEEIVREIQARQEEKPRGNAEGSFSVS